MFGVDEPQSGRIVFIGLKSRTSHVTAQSQNSGHYLIRARLYSRGYKCHLQLKQPLNYDEAKDQHDLYVQFL